ncbi:uncharacterized protein LOC122933256 isoform X2 [Bufo gargarizans]|uniref:uncharacterized protein LOC122933256 isoform X2 n=1 Tax=Bufo gargarizans TaxID=30331 RepID=UPI001CF39638|nr:uncharacterized protein LOC122933256 isoform X2 [Bufo gargarizans]
MYTHIDVLLAGLFIGVFVSGSDRSQAPDISLNPSLSEYSMGDSITIVCSPPKTLVVKKIQFYKEGHLQPLNEAEDNTFVVTCNKEVAGRYFCTYTLEIQERLITSLYSQHIIVNVSASIAQTTAAAIIPETSTLDKSSMIRGTETFTSTQSSKVINSTSSFKLLIYMFAGGLIFIATCVLIQALVRVYISRNGESPMVELPVPESNVCSVHSLKTTVPPFFGPSALQEIEMQHFYSEIEMPIVKAPIVTCYAKAKAIDPVPPIYQTDLTTHARI